uniref:Uncharacterized protein n=1 Tax=Zea mays TaxID=4577 RepID=A0A804QRM1_MAIZE
MARQLKKGVMVLFKLRVVCGIEESQFPTILFVTLGTGEIRQHHRGGEELLHVDERYTTNSVGEELPI